MYAQSMGDFTFRDSAPVSIGYFYNIRRLGGVY